ncbi:MAG: hypothetical protein HXY46_15140 [Syntrophaceae bacterium]|nr:hypothetical protein [Syntrophaceae bacterium]
MNVLQIKSLVSKATVGRIFAMTRSEWESHVREWVSPKRWEVKLTPTESGSSVTEHDPATGLELIIRPYYDNPIDPPESLFVQIHYPPGKGPKFTTEFRRDLEYELGRNLGPEYSVSVGHAKSPSFEEIELTIKKTG